MGAHDRPTRPVVIARSSASRARPRAGGERGGRRGCPRARGRRDSRDRLGKLYRARSRLCRRQILQVNMRLKALAEIYTMHSFAQLCNVKILPKSLLSSANFSKFKLL